MLSVSRVTRTKKQALRNYNRLSRWYDLLAGSSEEKYRRMGIQALEICSGEKVLEIGFGTGTSMLMLAEMVGAGGRVYGIDLSDGMASVTLDRLRDSTLGSRAALSLADGAWLPFGSNCLDAILMSFTLELFDTPEIPLVLSQCQRVLREEGRLAIVALQKTPSPGLPERLYEWSHSWMPVLVDCRPIDVDKEVEKAGFSKTNKLRETMWGLPVSIVTAVCPSER